MGYYIYELTGSASRLGILVAISAIPTLAFTLYGGALADRMDKKVLIQISQALFVVFAVTVGLLITTDVIIWQHLVIASFLHGCVMPFVMPARMAIIPQVVGRSGVMNAVAINSMGMSVITMGAPAFAGFFIYLFGVEGLFYVIAGMYGSAFLVTGFLPKYQNPVNASRGAVMSEILKGFKYLKANSVLIVLVLMGFVQLMMMFPIRFIMPIFAKDVFSVEANGLGIMMLFLGLGGLGGALFIASIGRIRRRGLMLVLTGILSGTVLLVFSTLSFFSEEMEFSPYSFTAGLLILLVMGTIQTGRQTMQQSLVMEYIDEEFRGRVMSINMLGWGIMPLGVLPLTIGTETFGAPVALGVLSVIFISISFLVLMFSPRLRQLR